MPPRGDPRRFSERHSDCKKQRLIMLRSLYGRRSATRISIATISCAVFAVRTPDPTRLTKVTTSYAMLAIRTPDPTRITTCCVRCSEASVDLRNTLRPNVGHSRMTCEARPTCEVDRLARSEQFSDLNTAAVWRGNALGSAGPFEWKAPWRAKIQSHSSNSSKSSKING